jgi:hypothetical protein
MLLKTILSFGFILICHAGFNQQTWRSVLYPADWTSGFSHTDSRFLHDFSYAGYHTREQEIPFLVQNLTDVTASPYYADNSGNADVTAILQNALDDLGKAGGGVVYLPAGTYRVKAGTNFKNGKDQSGEIAQNLFHQFKSCPLAGVFKNEIALFASKFKVHRRVNTLLDDPRHFTEHRGLQPA